MRAEVPHVVGADGPVPHPAPLPTVTPPASHVHLDTGSEQEVGAAALAEVNSVVEEAFSDRRSCRVNTCWPSPSFGQAGEVVVFPDHVLCVWPRAFTCMVGWVCV